MKQVEFRNKKKYSIGRFISIIIVAIVVWIVLSNVSMKLLTWLIMAFFVFLIYKAIKMIIRAGKGLNRVTGTIKTKKGFNINGQIDVINPFAGIFICGGAGAGKSASLVEPIIQQAAAKGTTGVVYDFKFPELAKVVENAYQHQTEIERYYIAFNDIAHSDKVNPIHPDIMKSAAFAREFATVVLNNINRQSFTKPDFWSDNSLVFLTAVFWFLRNNAPDYCTLPHAISLIMDDRTDKLISLLQTDDQCADLISPLAASIRSGANQQTAGVISSLQISLNKINTPEIYYLIGDNKNSIKLNLNSPESKAILTIGNDPTLSSTYSPIISLIVTAASRLMNTPGREESMLLIDEFPTLILPGIEQIPATARSNKISVVLAAQDIAQIIDTYGRDKTESLLANLGNQFYGRTTNITTAERVSKLFGKADRKMVTDNYSSGIFSAKNSSSHSYQERDLVKVQQVAGLETGSFFVQLSEGTNKQGKIKVPYKKFGRKELSERRQIDDDTIQKRFSEIRYEARQLLNF